MDPKLYEKFYDNKSKRPVHNFINIFLARNTYCICRDFLNIFISAYNLFFAKANNKHLVLADVRNATVEWYGIDKKTVDANLFGLCLLYKYEFVS